MYKGASRAMQHAHRVDRIDPSKGFVWRDDEQDLLPNAGNLSIAMCRDELRQSGVELAKLDNALAIAKREKDKEQAAFLGMQRSALCMRRSSVKVRQRELVSEHDAQLLTDAINLVCDEAVAEMIFAEARLARRKLIDSAQDDSL